MVRGPEEMTHVAGEGRGWGPVPVPIDLGIGCAENVVADESLLRAALAGARVAVLGDVAVSVGVGVSPAEAYLSRARAAACPVVRRSTGGSGLLHAPGDLAWTVVLPRRDPRIGGSYLAAYPRLGSGVSQFLEAFGVDARWIPAPGLSANYCTLSARGHVLMVGDRVLGGAAQHLTQNALLHHGFLPRTLDRPLIGRIFDLPGTDGVDRLTCLEELGLSEPAERQAEELAHALAEQLERR